MDKPKLTNADWVEIYYAVMSKKCAVERGDYGDDDAVETGAQEHIEGWIAHLDSIVGKIGPDGENMYDDE